QGIPDVLYGLPKIHKPNIPLRPIISAINSPNYNLAKFLVPILDPLTKTQYTLTDTIDFIICLNSSSFGTCFMTSFDIESLYTNLPISETINIITNELFHNN
ncbi:hypothetical protein DMUE_6035, partial [Dictyocoela muelleri]